MKTLALTFAVAFLAIVSVQCQDESRIVGGTNAVQGQVPYQVSLRLASGAHFCGGSIINDRWILTAAHCLYGSSPSYVTMGSIYLNSGFVRYDVLYSKHHIFYNQNTIQNDLGLIKTKTKIQFNAFVKPIALGTDAIPDGAQMFASGWGLVSFPGSTPPNIMQVLNTYVFNQNNCVRIWDGLPYGAKVTDGNLCVFKAAGQALCKGDSGGPVVWNNKLYGVTSFAVPCAQGYPDVLARVSANMWWINLVQTILFFP